MNRRPFLQALATGGAIVAAGCVDSLPMATDEPDASAVFEDYRYDKTDLVVRFRDDVDVRRAVLFDSMADAEYETIERPGRTARFQVVFPGRLETYVSGSLRVKAETPDGWTRHWYPGHVHGYAKTVEPLSDGRSRLEIENQADAPLLVRFVAIYGDVPNPTIDPQGESFERSALGVDPGVIGTGRNRPLSPTRADLVVPPGATRSYETTYAPFAFPDGAGADDCHGDERRGKIAIVHGSGGSAAYDFAYRLVGEPTALEGGTAAVCDDADSGEQSG